MDLPRHTPVDVAVVGGGISGLATAFELQRRGLTVAVFEDAPRAGGVIGTLRRDGGLVETGPNSSLDNTPLVNELLDALGIRSERVDASAVAATRYVVRGGKLVPLPTSPGAFLSTAAFTAGAKFRLWREPFVPPSPPDVEESIAAFVRRRLGAEFLDYAIDPFVAGIYAGDPERISVSAAFPRLHALEQKYGSLIKGQLKGAQERRRAGRKAPNAVGSFSFRHGMQTLTDALARAVTRVETGAHVERVVRNVDGSWTLSGRRGGESFEANARAVVLAVPSYEAAVLVRDLAPAAAQGLAAIPYAPIASVVAAHPRTAIAHSLAGFGFLVPRREQKKILGCLFSSSMFEGRAPAGSALLTTFVGGARQPELAGGTDAELVAIVQDDLHALLGARGEPTWTTITRWTRAIPQYNLGHRDRLRPVEDAERALPGLWFCANYRGGVSVGDRIQAARATAETVAPFLGTAG